MATQLAGNGTFVANTALSAFRAVVLSNNRGITYAGASAIPDGFSGADAASGDYVDVKFFFNGGTHKCEITACPVTVGDALYAGALGRVSTTGTITVGKSLTTATANGSVIELLAVR
jgi:hypothetical protein